MKIGYIFVAVAALFFLALSQSYGSEYHHSQPVMPANTTNTNIYSTKGVALGIAAAQHHYKALSKLQWSIGGGNYNGSSAISGGLAIQAGKVFVSGNVSSDGTTAAIGFGLSDYNDSLFSNFIISRN